jgi:HEAT repeat protein
MPKHNTVLLALVVLVGLLAATAVLAQPEAVPQYFLPPETRQLLQQLRSPDAGRCVAAATALPNAPTGMGTTARDVTHLKIAALTEALGDADPGVRRAVVEAFIDFRTHWYGDLIRSALLTALRDQDSSIRLLVVEELGKRYAGLIHRPNYFDGMPVDPHLLPELSRLQEDPDPAVRRAVLLARGWVGVPEVLEPLLALCVDPDAGTRAVTLTILGPYADPRVAPALAAALEDVDPGASLAAALALAKRHDPRGIDVLAAALLAAEIPDLEMIGQLGQFHDRRVTATLIELLAKHVQALDIAWMEEIPNSYSARNQRRQGSSAGRLVIGLLEEQGAVAVPPLLDRLTDDSSLVRQAAAIILMHIRDHRAVPALVAALEDDAPAMRQVAARALRVFGDVATLPALTAALRDADPAVRGEAALALGGVQDTRALPALLEALHDPNLDVQFAAAWALGRIPDPRAVEPLIEVLTTNVDRGVGERSAEALGYIADRRAVPSLIAALGDENLRVRDRAAFALGLIGDRAAVEPLLAMLNDPAYEEPYQGIRPGDFRLTGKGCIRRLGGDNWSVVQEYRGYRPSAALALGLIGDPRAVDALVALLKKEPWLRDPAVKALAAIPDIRTIEALFSLDPKSVWQVEQQLIYGRVRDEAGPWLVAQLRSPDPLLRVRAARYLRRMAGQIDMAARPLVVSEVTAKKVPGAADALALLLQDGDPGARREAALALAAYGDRRAIPALLSLFHEKDAAYSAFLAILPFLDDPAVRKAMLDDVANPDPRIRTFAIMITRGIGMEALQSVRENLAALVKQPVALTIIGQEKIAYTEAAKALGMLGDPRALEPLLRLLDCREIDSRSGRFDSDILGILAQYRDPRAVDALRRQPDPQPVELYRMKDPPAEVEPAVREQLLTNLRHENVLFRLNTMELLARMKARWAVPALIDMLDDPAGNSNMNPREVAAGALARIGDPAAVEPLIARLDTGDLPSRQAAAAAALGQLGDPRAIPPLIAYLEHIAGYQFSMTGESWQPYFKLVRPVPVEALKSITGQNFGEDAAKWREWWAANGPK